MITRLFTLLLGLCLAGVAADIYQLARPGSDPKPIATAVVLIVFVLYGAYIAVSTMLGTP